MLREKGWPRARSPGPQSPSKVGWLPDGYTGSSRKLRPLIDVGGSARSPKASRADTSCEECAERCAASGTQTHLLLPGSRSSGLARFAAPCDPRGARELGGECGMPLHPKDSGAVLLSAEDS